MWIFSLFFFAISIITPNAGLAAPQATVSATKGEVAVGESFLYEITLTWPQDEADYKFALPDLPLSNLALLRRGESQESFIANNRVWLRKMFTYEFQALREGEASIHGFALPYIDPSGQKGGTLRVSETRLRVRPAQAPWSKHLAWVAALVLAVGASMGGWLLVHRKKNSSPHLAPQDLSREEKAIQEIRTLDPVQGPLETIKVLNQSLRRYLIETYELSARMATDREILQSLRGRHEVAREEIRLLEQIFDQLDELKFAGRRADSKAVAECTERIVHYLQSKRVVGQPSP